MMSKEAFKQWFLNEISGRWTTCQFTAVQLADWYGRLNRYDEPTLTEASRQHYVRDEPRRPSLKAIYDYARQIQAARGGWHGQASLGRSTQDAGVPEAHTYIQCVAKDENGNGPVGRFVPILLWPFHREYTQAMYDKTAEQQRVMHQHSVGGVWEIVANATYARMQTRRWELTGQLERIEQTAAQLRAHLTPKTGRG